MPVTYNAVISGLGNIAWKFGATIDGDPLSHAAAYESHSRVALAGGCDPAQVSRAGFFEKHGGVVLEELEPLLERVRPDIVSVCSPTGLHFEQVKVCIEREVPMVWVEKPPAATCDQLRELVSLNEQRGGKTTVAVNYQRRYSGCYIRLKETLENRLMGEPRRISINYSRGLLVNGVHFVDLVFYLLGEDLRYTLNWVSNGGDSPSFVVTCENGVEIVVQGDALDYHNNEISVTFDNGRMSVLHGGETTRMEVRVENALFPGFHRLVETEENILAPAGLEGAFLHGLTDLIQASETSTDPRSPLRSSLSCQELIEQLFEWSGA